MSNTIGETPIEKRPEHEVLDSTKIKSFQSCPREFFFKYILGWQSETPNVHLAFGSAWHEALEFFHQHGMSDKHIQKACFIFDEIFNKEKPQLLSDEHASKNSQNAHKALKEYAESYRHLDDFEVLHSETAGTAPIREDRVIHFKCDLIIEDTNGEIWSMEHKTTGRGGKTWKSRWGLDFQVNAYAHAVASLYADRYEDVAGVKINGAILRKSGNNEFIRIPNRKSPKDLQLWLQECNHWVDMIDWNWKLLRQTSVSDDIMFAFPRNPTSCTKYGCAFDGLCENWSNPLQHCGEPPVGYEEDHWDPRRQEEEADNVVNLEESDEVKQNEGSQRQSSGLVQSGSDDGDDKGGAESSGDGNASSESGGETRGNSGGLLDVV